MVGFKGSMGQYHEICTSIRTVQDIYKKPRTEG